MRHTINGTNNSYEKQYLLLLINVMAYDQAETLNKIMFLIFVALLFTIKTVPVLTIFHSTHKSSLFSNVVQQKWFCHLIFKSGANHYSMH